MFGEEDVINGRRYTTTVRCSSSTAVLYQIKAKEFIQKLYRDEKTFKQINQRIIDKDKQTFEKLKSAAKRMDPEFLNKFEKRHKSIGIERVS